MKRIVALWAAVPVFLLATWTTEPIAQTPPGSAPGDTLSTPPAQAPAPASTTPTPPGMTAPPVAPADTMTAAQRIRRAQTSAMSYVISFGLGTSIQTAPEAFTDEYSPSFGLYLDGGVRRWGFETTLSFDYNFFFTNRLNPEDMNIFNLFLNVKYRPFDWVASPYGLVCGGWWRSWIVDELDPADPPLTVVHETERGDNYYAENVLGYGFGAGVEVEMDKTRRIFFEGRYVEGMTRETENKENMVLIPLRLGLTWEF